MPGAGSEALEGLASLVLGDGTIATALTRAEPKPGAISVMALCAQLAASKAHLPIAFQQPLIALCRKVCVAKVMYSEYTTAWRPVPGARPLEHDEWLALAGVCFACAAPLATGDRGMALHLVNAGFRALARVLAPTQPELLRNIEKLGDAVIVATQRT